MVDTNADERTTVEDIWAVIAEVPDPEVPALTLNDLGIIREVSIEDGQTHITLTPTYMGCPATMAIRQMVYKAVVDAGFAPPVMHERLDPPWTTDWISEEGHEKLRRYGIAPPNGSADGHRNAPKACPHCGSADTEVVSQFGSTACKALYRCNSCKEPFEYFKCH